MLALMPSNKNITDINLSNNPIDDQGEVFNEKIRGYREGTIHINSSGRQEALQNYIDQNQRLEKFKVVILIADDVNKSVATTVTNANEGLSNVKVLTTPFANFENFGFFDIHGRTNENTIFVIWAHGTKKGQEHFVDKVETKKFLEELQNQLYHKISATLLACYCGAALKAGKIADGISLMVRSSSKYETLTFQNAQAILKILEWKINNNLLNQEIYERFLLDPETLYFHGENANDKVSKFSRIGKFDLTEIKNLLKKIKYDENWQ